MIDEDDNLLKYIGTEVVIELEHNEHVHCKIKGILSKWVDVEKATKITHYGHVRTYHENILLSRKKIVMIFPKGEKKLKKDTNGNWS